jgi:chemotaxis protein MotA
MDPATLIGVGLAFTAIFGSMIMEGGNIGSLFLIPPMLLVFGGTFGAAIAGSLLRDVKSIHKSLIRAVTARASIPDGNVATLVSLADRARRDGLLAIEGDIGQIEDPFLRRALEMVVDGNDADEIAEILGGEIDA